MTTAFNIGIDWNRDGFICWDARLAMPLTYYPTL